MTRIIIVGILAGVALFYGFGWLVAGEPESRTYGWISVVAGALVYLLVP